MKGFIIKSISGDFHVLNLENNKIYKCKVRGQIRNKNLLPICGDNVEFEYDESTNFSIITELLPRKNELIRPPIANVDIALIVMSTIQPNYDSYLVDKLIVAATLQNIEPVLIISKCEFMTEEIKTLTDNYAFAGYNVIEVSTLKNINLPKINDLIIHKKVVLCGQSAVGKSSLINSLLENNTRRIGDYSKKLGRGKHQTREVEFIHIHGAYVADTPGFSRLDLKVNEMDLARIFKDFNLYAKHCKFNSCLHINEPNCAVKEAVKKGLIDSRRYENYLHLMKEIKEGKQVWRKK